MPDWKRVSFHKPALWCPAGGYKLLFSFENLVLDTDQRELRAGGTVEVPSLGGRQVQTFDDRDYVRLLMWEALESPGRATNQALRRSFYQRWVDAVAAEQAAGHVDADLDPAQLVLSEIMLVLGPVMLPQITKLVTGKSVSDPEFLTERKRFLDLLEERYHAAARARD